jgi:hypothetical protein
VAAAIDPEAPSLQAVVLAANAAVAVAEAAVALAAKKTRPHPSSEHAPDQTVGLN